VDKIVSRVWIIGPLAWDSVLEVPHLPEAGGFVQGRGLTGRPGGTAANVAVGLASSGVRTGFAGYVGTDELSEKLLTALEASKIEKLHIKRLSGAANHVLVLIDAHGERTIVGLSDSRLSEVTIQDVDLSPDDSVVFVLWRNFFLEDLTYAQNVGCKIIVGLEALEAVPQISADICIGSRSDLRADLDIDRYLHRFGRIIVTNGVEGAHQYSREGSVIKEIYQPAIPIDKVVDTTGAGDSFLAGYIKQLVDPLDTDENPMIIGAHWSALAVSRSGSHPPDWSEVVTRIPRS